MNGSELSDLKVLSAEIKHLRELMEERFKSISKALELQAIETERRLVILNHENARVLKQQEQSVNKEAFDVWKYTVDKYMASRTAARVETSHTETDVARQRTLIATWAGWGVGLLSLLYLIYVNIGV